MILYFLYRIGQSIALFIPRKLGYRISVFITGFKFFFSRAERRAMMGNLKCIVGEDAPNLVKYPRFIYANFGRYLVDFFRAAKVDKQFVEEFIKIENLHYMDEALKKGNGVIGLTAHLGNWELCAQVMGIMGYKMNAVALTHTNSKIDDFFSEQRQSKGVNVIPVGVSVRKCFAALKRNEIVGILGDRDFSGENGIPVDFFSKTMLAPKGPAVLSLRTKAAIIPAFVIRDEKDDQYFKYIFEQPIYPEYTGDEQADIRKITEQYVKVIERTIKKYPKQWFMFHEFWKAGKSEVV
ncbi:MAG: lysophospholipid acyltransferase family protein [Candidatus Omnitrophica bacterium]|nr:lysophospholipid acyltransferase family protein [Candidatus Omnitrophota bacterium]